jgi:hypothetical protein
MVRSLMGVLELKGYVYDICDCFVGVIWFSESHRTRFVLKYFGSSHHRSANGGTLTCVQILLKLFHPQVYYK